MEAGCKAILSVSFLLCGCAANTDKKETETDTGNNDATSSESTTNTAQTTLEVTGVGMALSDYSADAITWGPGNIKKHARPVDPVNLQDKYGELGGKWLSKASPFISRSASWSESVIL